MNAQTALHVIHKEHADPTGVLERLNSAARLCVLVGTLTDLERRYVRSTVLESLNSVVCFDAHVVQSLLHLARGVPPPQLNGSNSFYKR